MKKFLIHTQSSFFLLLGILFSASAFAQTLTLNDSKVLQSTTNRIGLNIGVIDSYDNGQMLKNLVGSINPGFEPMTGRAIWVLGQAGTTTTFTEPDPYDNVTANYWQGGTFSVVDTQSGGAEMGCTGTIASNTGGVNPVFTVSSPCAAAFSIGDQITLTKTFLPTPQAWYLQSGGEGGFWPSVSGGGQFESDTTDLCPTCGQQALKMDATATGSSVTANQFFDATNYNIFVMMNGTFQGSFWAKTASGNPTMTVSVHRLSTGGFSCATYTPKLTSTWTQYTFSCTASESTAATQIGPIAYSVNVTGGAAYLDNISFEKTSGNPNNTTVFRDEVIETLQKYFGNGTPGPSGPLRYWMGQNGETLDNWIAPDYARGPSSGGPAYFMSVAGAADMHLSLEDYLELCQYLNQQPYFEIPVTFSNAEAAGLIEFLASPSSTTYGAKRAALGQTEPWTSVFSQIHMSFCNECWNGFAFGGQALPFRATAPTNYTYFDYGIRSAAVLAAIHKDPYYVASSFDLVMNEQTGQTSGMDPQIAMAGPDSIEIEAYSYTTVTSFANDAALWGPVMVEPYQRVTMPNDPAGFNASVTDIQAQKTCGANGNAACKVNIYEWGQGTYQGSLDQKHLDYINAGAGQGVVMALQPLLNMQYFGILPQSFFALAGYQDGSSIPNTVTKLWGNVIDMGGATNLVRPEFLGLELINQSIIGPMYSCPISSNVTQNFPLSVNGDNDNTLAQSNVPYLYSFCFENGTARSLVLVNTDLNNSHTLTIAGTNTPSGTVTQRQFAPTTLDGMNEAPTGSPTNLTPATSFLTTSTLTNPTSITLPPHSVTALDFGGSLPAAAAPVFSLAAGTYNSDQTVTISDSNAGTTIYYTTDGSTPSTSSNVYSGPISVDASETLQAIAVESNYANSPVTSASYVISSVLATPTFSVAAGNYTGTQSVTISDVSSGAAIYYTTNGTTPTTASTLYSGPIAVTASETLEAVAVETGYSNSPVAVAAYTITPALPPPSFSLAPGVYTTSQTVTISAPVPASASVKAAATKSNAASKSTAATATSATVYYTTNGTTPTTSSNVYSGPIAVDATETLQAISVASGYAPSPVAAAAYTIVPALPAPTFSVAAGSYATVQSVAISDATPGTTIYYTTNGTAPTATSPVYSGPITVSATETIEAVAVENGYTASSVAKATYTLTLTSTTYINLASGGFAAGLFDLNGGATVTSTGALQITDGGGAEARSAWYAAQVPVQSFVTDFTFQQLSANADGMTFTIQGAGAKAVGLDGGSLGYQGIAKSVAIKFDLHNNAGEGNDSTGIYTGGAAPTVPSIDLTSTGINLHSSDVMHAHLVYDGANLTMTLTDTVTNGTVTEVFPVNIPSLVGANTAWIGFTGGTGGKTATQNVLTWTYSSAAGGTTGAALTAPVFSPAGGAYTASQSVTIAELATGASIYYTTNGTVPTASSAKYTGPITVSKTETLKAVAIKTGQGSSPVATISYTIGATLAAPTISKAGGTYPASQTVTISDSQSGATICFTTDGSTPTAASTHYSGPITVSSSENLQAIAIEAGYFNSPVVSVNYIIETALPTPTFSISAGTYATGQTLTIQDASASALVFYTTNGTIPTSASTRYTGPITLTKTQTIKAIAAQTGFPVSAVAVAVYTIEASAPKPTFSVAAGTYGATQTVSLKDSAAGLSIFYTTDGTAPTTSSTKYTAPITVSATETIRAIAAGKGYVQSAVAASKYSIEEPAAVPVLSAGAGTYTGTQTIAITDATPGATIYYTTNGATPTASSTKYTVALKVESTETIKAIATAAGKTASAVASAKYTIEAPVGTPAPSIASGTYSAAQAVTFTSKTPGAVIYYTVNGTTPTTASTRYAAPIHVAETETIKAIAVVSGRAASAVASVKYTIETPALAPAPSVAAGTYTAAQVVTLTSKTPGTAIYYTTNGSTPTTASTRYTEPIHVTKTETIKSIATAAEHTQSTVASATYSIKAAAAAAQ